jgi:hypothetical protein
MPMAAICNLCELSGLGLQDANPCNQLSRRVRTLSWDVVRLAFVL